MTFLLYLCKVFVCSGILLGYYWLFLRNRRFHHYNRFYLHATLLLSVILPFLKIPVLYQPQNRVNQVVYQTVDVLTVNYGEQDTMVGATRRLSHLFTLQNMLYLLYGAGILVLLVMLAKSLLYIRKISRRYPCERISELKFYATTEPGTPFSFFRSIFWDSNLPFNSREGQQVFQHELFHVQQKHSVDIILAEIITAFFWCNPFFHLLKKELKAIHEFLADQYAISGNDRYAYAELLVMQTMKLHTVPVTNHFFQNHIKRRIAMITNLSSSRYGYISRLMILPVCLLLFCTIVLYAQQPVTTAPAVAGNHSSKPFTVIIDAGHGGMDNGATSADGKVLEKDLALAISLKIQQLAPQYNVNVVMTRTTDILPGNASNIRDGLKIRTAMAQQANADAFIAIHVSSTGSDNAALNKQTSGFEAFITKNDQKMLPGSKQLGNDLLQSVASIYETNPTLLQRADKNIWVLERNACPAVILECGYVTNDKDVAYMSKADNQEAVAKKILEGIVNYKNQLNEKPATPVVNL
jgi:N-acetylmuramoyl-L-alanine amidase